MSMTELLATGRVLDAILAGMAIETAVLAWRGVALRLVLPYLGSGMAMLLAWRLAVGGAWWGWISACLALAGLLHLLDLRRRLRLT